MKKALLTFQEMIPSDSIAESVAFKASKGWFEKFMYHNDLSLRRKTSVAQNGADKLILYIIHV